MPPLAISARRASTCAAASAPRSSPALSGERGERRARRARCAHTRAPGNLGPCIWLRPLEKIKICPAAISSFENEQGKIADILKQMEGVVLKGSCFPACDWLKKVVYMLTGGLGFLPQEQGFVELGCFWAASPTRQGPGQLLIRPRTDPYERSPGVAHLRPFSCCPDKSVRLQIGEPPKNAGLLLCGCPFKSPKIRLPPKHNAPKKHPPHPSAKPTARSKTG